MFKFEELTFGFSENKKWGPVSQTLAPGQVVQVLGRNGSGKSTFLRTLAGVQKQLSGQVSGGSGIFLPSQAQIHFGVTGKELLQILGVSLDLPQSLTDLIDWGIDKLLDTSLDRMSAGERQRILLVCYLNTSQEVVFLDEPLTHLDDFWIFKLAKLLHQKALQGKIILMTNHNFNFALQFPSAACWLMKANHGMTMKCFEQSSILFQSLDFREEFGLNSQMLINPLDGSQLLALSSIKT
jgi:ABC-type cobalamin/Fe3+-siderophores transport system ATPase subunit